MTGEYIRLPIGMIYLSVVQVLAFYVKLRNIS